MKPNLNSRDIVKSSLLMTIVVAALLVPAVIIAWICKWVYNSRK